MIVRCWIMCQNPNKGHVIHELIGVDDMFESNFEPAHKVLEWFLRMLDDLEEIAHALRILYL